MAKFGKDDDENAQQNDYIDNAIADSQADLDAKRDSLANQQLQLIKGQGAQNWNPIPQQPAKPPATAAAGSSSKFLNEINKAKADMYPSAQKAAQAQGWKTLNM